MRLAFFGLRIRYKVYHKTQEKFLEIMPALAGLRHAGAQAPSMAAEAFELDAQKGPAWP
jgi:hypothetical protein